MTDPTVLAVDIGGTKLAAALVDRSGGVNGRRQCATPAGTDAEALFGELAALIAAVLDGARPGAVGIGCGGPMDWLRGRVSPLNIPAWRDFPLRDRVGELLDAPVVALHNDAVAMAVGEQRYGAGRDRSAFLGIVVSTGVGGGLVLDGQPYAGRTGNAGHIGHVVVDPAGPPCACGGRGCLEAIARGPAVVASAQERGWTGQPADGRALVAAARDGDPLAVAAFARAGDALGVAIASVAAVVDLDGVAVGGGLGNAGDLLLEPARKAFQRHAGLDFVRDLHIAAAALGGDAGLVGAAALAFDAQSGAAD